MPFTKYSKNVISGNRLGIRYSAVSTFRSKEAQPKRSTTALSCTGPATYTRSLIYAYIHSVCIHTKLTNDCPLCHYIHATTESPSCVLLHRKVQLAQCLSNIRIPRSTLRVRDENVVSFDVDEGVLCEIRVFPSVVVLVYEVYLIHKWSQSSLL